MNQQGFNPKSRWDKYVPETEYTDDPGKLNEAIQVLAFFKNARIYPRLFIWNEKKYKITAVNYNWQEHCARELISYFSVTTGCGLYQISFNNTTFSWRINKIIE